MSRPFGTNVMSADNIPAVRLLTRLFVRRLLDNDVISPHADRHDSLGVLYAVIVSLAVFVTFFVSTPYLAAYIQLPGQTALSALPDRFLFIAASLAISALAALLVWDALGLEPRDAAILGPLPIAPWAITRAKLLAALVFGVLFSIAINVVPTILYPTFMTMNLRGVSVGGIVRLIAAQAISVTMAGLLGFFAVLAARGVLRLVLGERGFGRVSSGVQSILVVAAVTGLMLTPTIRGKTVTEWVAGSVVPPRYFALPVLWHLGVNEIVAGDVVVDAPAVTPRRLTLPAWLRREDDEHRSAYRALRANLATLARWAWLVVPAVVSLAVLTFVWNNRRLPEQVAARPAHSRTRAAVRAIALRLTRGDPEAQAGFFFTLHALMRSGPHRMIVAIAVAAALTLSSVMLILGSAHLQERMSSVPLRLLGMQVMVLLVLIGAFRYAVMVPAELVANWSIRLAWRGDERGYLAGVKRAALLCTVVVPIAHPPATACRTLRGRHGSRSHALRLPVLRRGTGWPVPVVPKSTIRLRLSAARRPEAAVVGRGRGVVGRALRLRVHRTGGIGVTGADCGARCNARRNRPGNQDHRSRSTP